MKEQIDILKRGTSDILSVEELESKLRRSAKDGRPLRVKFGIDPTSPDIHLGHTVPMAKLRQFQDMGHQAVIIIGDFTARVGDPSQRSKTRPQLSASEIDENAGTYLEQVGRVIDLKRAEVVRNSEWFERLEFQRLLEIASKMTVARMLERDDFSKRYNAGDPIAIHEFIYPLMQGYDSVVIRADVEIGATDQTFNLLVGRDLQRDAGLEAQVCVTMPILVGTDGTLKMSKSYGNNIGIAESAREMFGKVMSVPDALMENYFELLTTIPMNDVRAIISEGHPRDVKERLAREIVGRYHGSETADREAEEFRRVFSEGRKPEEMPEVVITADMFEDGRVWIVKLLTHAELASSSSEARRFVEQGAVKLADASIRDPKANVPVADGDIISAGKRRFARLRVR